MTNQTFPQSRTPQDFFVETMTIRASQPHVLKGQVEVIRLLLTLAGLLQLKCVSHDATCCFESYQFLPCFVHGRNISIMKMQIAIIY